MSIDMAAILRSGAHLRGGTVFGPPPTPPWEVSGHLFTVAPSLYNMQLRRTDGSLELPDTAQARNGWQYVDETGEWVLFATTASWKGDLARPGWNRLLYSGDLAGAAWAAVLASSAPNGTLPGGGLVWNKVTGTHPAASVSQGTLASATGRHVISVFVRKPTTGASEGFSIRVTDTGAAIAQASFLWQESGPPTLGGDWAVPITGAAPPENGVEVLDYGGHYRVVIYTAAATSGNSLETYLYPQAFGGVIGACDFSTPQLEVDEIGTVHQSFAAPPLVTTSGPLARGAPRWFLDKAEIPFQEGSWVSVFRQDVEQVLSLSKVGQKSFYSILGDTRSAPTSQGVMLYTNAGVANTWTLYRRGNAGVVTLDTGESGRRGARNSIAASWSGSESRVYWDGALRATGAGDTVDTALVNPHFALGDSAYTSTDEALDGQLVATAFFGRALHEAEVANVTQWMKRL